MQNLEIETFTDPSVEDTQAENIEEVIIDNSLVRGKNQPIIVYSKNKNLHTMYSFSA